MVYDLGPDRSSCAECHRLEFIYKTGMETQIVVEVAMKVSGERCGVEVCGQKVSFNRPESI